jgi:hypothetical protein
MRAAAKGQLLERLCVSSEFPSLVMGLVFAAEAAMATLIAPASGRFRDAASGEACECDQAGAIAPRGVERQDDIANDEVEGSALVLALSEPSRRAAGDFADLDQTKQVLMGELEAEGWSQTFLVAEHRMAGDNNLECGQRQGAIVRSNSEGRGRVSG